jgi:plastin-1
MADALAHNSKLEKVQGETGVHSYSDDETIAFSDFINDNLKNDPDLTHVLPLSQNDLYKAVEDGILLW